MRAAGFTHLKTSDDLVIPGTWVATSFIDGVETLVPIDLIVPEAAANVRGRRAARLGAHGNIAARKSAGLEAVLVDHATMTIGALDPADLRSIDVEVAGVAALIIAKLHKIHDRSSGRPDRLSDKDAADVYRIMQTTSVHDIATTLAELRDHPLAGQATSVALEYLEELFGRRGRAGIVMAQRALQLAIPEAQVETLCVSFTSRLLALA